MRVKIILNPYANRWRSGERAATVHEACRAAGLDVDLSVTEYPGQGIQLARAAADGPFAAVVAAGGDGTINEVINGLLQASPTGPTKPFGIIPLGTANDFNLMAGLPARVVESVQVIAGGHTRQVDAGQINERYFINNSAAAMEPVVTIENIKMKRLSGEVRYVVALFKALASLKPWHMELVWDGGGYDGPAYLLSMCNTPRTGGFTMAPGAVFDDGQLDLVFAPEVPKRRVLLILAALLRGEHIQYDEVTFCRVTRLTGTSRPGTPLHADGEVFTESAETLDYRVLPRAVTLLSPAAGG